MFYHLLKNGNQREKEILGDKNSIIIRTPEELEKYTIEALDNSNSKKYLHLGLIPVETIKNIRSKITDIKKEKVNEVLNESLKYDLTINQEEIRHLRKASLNIQDIISFVQIIDRVIVEFDSVRYAVYRKEQHVLRFKNNSIIIHILLLLWFQMLKEDLELIHYLF